MKYMHIFQFDFNHFDDHIRARVHRLLKVPFVNFWFLFLCSIDLTGKEMAADVLPLNGWYQRGALKFYSLSLIIIRNGCTYADGKK